MPMRRTRLTQTAHPVGGWGGAAMESFFFWQLKKIFIKIIDKLNTNVQGCTFRLLITAITGH
jgi:hypothetical protein